jgi:hypothetical protein
MQLLSLVGCAQRTTIQGQYRATCCRQKCAAKAGKLKQSCDALRKYAGLLWAVSITLIKLQGSEGTVRPGLSLDQAKIKQHQSAAYPSQSATALPTTRSITAVELSAPLITVETFPVLCLCASQKHKGSSWPSITTPVAKLCAARCAEPASLYFAGSLESCACRVEHCLDCLCGCAVVLLIGARGSAHSSCRQCQGKEHCSMIDVLTHSLCCRRQHTRRAASA